MSAPVVLVTGALSGIGRATAEAFAREGAKVVISGRNAETGEALAVELRNLGGEAHFIRADVRHEEDLRALVDGTVEKFGRLDIAVNNAGTEGQFGPITDQTPESYATMFDTNVLGVLLSMKHQLRVLQAQGSGSIINISSVLGQAAYANAALYTASKHAVEGLTKAAALEGAPFGVRVNAVAPGPIDTPMLDRFTGGEEGKAGLASTIPLARTGAPDEIAQAVVFLASDKASFITGHVVNVDGGKRAAL
jgi:NAD(P)-dependent dehydrogenase (short-subunit alcohol dehydrogenase family)